MKKIIIKRSPAKSSNTEIHNSMHLELVTTLGISYSPYGALSQDCNYILNVSTLE